MTTSAACAIRSPMRIWTRRSSRGASTSPFSTVSLSAGTTSSAGRPTTTRHPSTGHVTCRGTIRNGRAISRTRRRSRSETSGRSWAVGRGRRRIDPSSRATSARPPCSAARSTRTGSRTRTCRTPGSSSSGCCSRCASSLTWSNTAISSGAACRPCASCVASGVAAPWRSTLST